MLLVSPNFLESDFVMETELPDFLHAAESEDVRIVWILLTACLYSETEIGGYQVIRQLATTD